MLKTISAFVLGALFGAPALVVAQASWVSKDVTLGWNKLPNPDETGSSSAQVSKLLASDTVTYEKNQEVEIYRIVSSESGYFCETMVPVGQPFAVSVGKPGIEYYHGNRASKALVVNYNVNQANLPPLNAAPASGPNG